MSQGWQRVEDEKTGTSSNCIPEVSAGFCLWIIPQQSYFKKWREPCSEWARCPVEKAGRCKTSGSGNNSLELSRALTQTGSYGWYSCCGRHEHWQKGQRNRTQGLKVSWKKATAFIGLLLTQAIVKAMVEIQSAELKGSFQTDTHFPNYL